jgi:hypothetical protein
MRESRVAARAAPETACTWCAPVVRVHRIDEITRLDFNTNFDGGIATNVIDGTAIGCN